MANWTKEEIQNVWEKGEAVAGFDSKTYRKDQCGAWMKRDEHGNRDSILGWEIDHIKTVSKDGTNALSNLRPLQWENNVGRGDGRLKTIVTSEGRYNVRTSSADDAA